MDDNDKTGGAPPPPSRLARDAPPVAPPPPSPHGSPRHHSQYASPQHHAPPPSRYARGVLRHEHGASPPHSRLARDDVFPEQAVPPPRNGNRTDGVPHALVDHLTELEEWATQNKLDARKDLASFWILKIPAILSSASAGILGHFSLTTVSVISGAIASVCVIIDGIHPRGMLRNTHLRAYHDIRILSSQMSSKWRSRSPASKDENVARAIIRDGEAERARIAAYVRDAETALRVENNA